MSQVNVTAQSKTLVFMQSVVRSSTLLQIIFLGESLLPSVASELNLIIEVLDVSITASDCVLLIKITIQIMYIDIGGVLFMESGEAPLKIIFF